MTWNGAGLCLACLRKIRKDRASGEDRSESKAREITKWKREKRLGGAPKEEEKREEKERAEKKRLKKEHRQREERTRA